MHRSEIEVIEGVAAKAEWWVGNRRKKLTELRHDSHAVNPFLWPLIMSMHGFSSFRELAAFQLAGHLVEGHATGFGKLVDEKILEDVFGTHKLDRKLRASTTLYRRPEYDSIDHIVPRDDGPDDLLSLKAGKWSIQLGQAVSLNRSFTTLLREREHEQADFGQIVVGVLYGTEENLTDKYRLIRGVRGKTAHDVTNISDHVFVKAGREFWTWLNHGEANTQEWVLEGLQLGFRRDVDENGPLDVLFEDFIEHYAETFASLQLPDGTIDWHQLLINVNG